MNETNEEKWLDDLISQSINSRRPQFDAEKWKQKYREEFQVLLSRARQAPTEPNIWRTIMKNRITELAAAAVITIVVAIGIYQFGGSIGLTSAAWAQVVRAFNEATDIHVVKTYTSADGRVVRENEAWIKNQTCFRAEARDWCIIDDGKSVLTLYKDHKIAHLRESLTPYWDYTPLILKVFRDSQSENGITLTRVPEECTETEQVYQIDFRGCWQGTAWVDAASGLPSRITGREKEYEGQTREVEVTFDYEPIANEVFRIVMPADYRELPRITSSEGLEERKQILMGKVVDEKGNPVGSARVFGSFAQQGRADESGQFSLVISPTDSSNSLGPMDFPMFVWAYKDDEPYRMAWTVIRHPECERSEEGDAVIEDTHQGVKLVINDEEELSASIPGSPGELFGDDPRVRDIVLVLGAASVVTGRVTNASGSPIPNAVVRIEELEMQLGKNMLTVSNLDHEWKAEAFAISDNDGYYSLNNLPAAWTTIRLRVDAYGYATGRQIFQNDRGNTVDGYDLQLIEGEQQDNATTPVEFEGAPKYGGYGGYRRARD